MKTNNVLMPLIKILEDTRAELKSLEKRLENVNNITLEREHYKLFQKERLIQKHIEIELTIA